MYGFEGEVKAKYSGQMVDAFTEVYNLLPLAHCIEGVSKKILVMHGGLFSKVSLFSFHDNFLSEVDFRVSNEGIIAQLDALLFKTKES